MNFLEAVTKWILSQDGNPELKKHLRHGNEIIGVYVDGIDTEIKLATGHNYYLDITINELNNEVFK